jgi:hypothetical protein
MANYAKIYMFDTQENILKSQWTLENREVKSKNTEDQTRIEMDCNNKNS